MNSQLNQLFSKDKIGENVLIGLLVAFIVIGHPIPKPLNELIDTQLGVVVVIIIAISLFAFSPVLGVVGLIVAYQIIRKTGTFAIGMYMPSEEKKWKSSEKDYNHATDNLEQDVIRNMAPIVQPDLGASTGDFSPSLGDTHSAAML
jgi:hypothetical protein